MFLPWDKNHKEVHPYFRCVGEETFCSAGFGVGVAWIGESAVGWGVCGLGSSKAGNAHSSHLQTRSQLHCL